MHILRDNSGKSPIVMILVAVIVLLIGVGGFAFMKMSAAGKESAQKKVLTPWKLDEFVANLADQAEPRYLKTSIVLEVEGEPKGAGGEGGVSIEEVKVRDIINRVLSEKLYAELLSDKGRALLKTQLIEALNPVLEEYDIRVESIYFTSFQMQ